MKKIFFGNFIRTFMIVLVILTVSFSSTVSASNTEVKTKDGKSHSVVAHKERASTGYMRYYNGRELRFLNPLGKRLFT